MNFVCVYWGDKYKPEYVQNLYNMVQRNTTHKINFICFTDHVKLQKLVQGDIEVRQLPFHDYQTWWNKLQLFSPEANLIGETLYMDLDVVILANIDDMFTHGETDTFSIINNFNLSTKIFNSSIMKFNNETATNIIWRPWLADRNTLQREAGDQDVVSKLASNNPKFRIFPDGIQDIVSQIGHLKEVSVRWLCSTVSQTHTNVSRNGLKTTGNSEKLLKITLPSAVRFDAA